MQVCHGRVKTKGRQLEVMADLKRSIIVVKAEQNCLAHALIIAIARVNDDPNYKAYRDGYKIRPEVDNLLQTTEIDLIKAAVSRSSPYSNSISKIIGLSSTEE
jgi:hypothetical protein